MISRRDTRRAVEILARYQGILRSPEEKPLQGSIEKVVHIFQSELFQALLDIQQCYELNLLSACEQDGTVDLEPGRLSKNQEEGSARSYLESHGGYRQTLKGKLQGQAAWNPALGPAPRLVRVTETRTELPAQVCSVVVGVCSSLPKVQVK